jgi:hypothetical protein
VRFVAPPAALEVALAAATVIIPIVTVLAHKALVSRPRLDRPCASVGREAGCPRRNQASTPRRGVLLWPDAALT